MQAVALHKIEIDVAGQDLTGRGAAEAYQGSAERGSRDVMSGT